jgi:hypothetical protein
MRRSAKSRADGIKLSLLSSSEASISADVLHVSFAIVV